MPDSWTKKDERQYQHIVASERRGGSPSSRAKEIAARTVNRQRRREGRTRNVTTSGTGNPGSPLESRSVAELRNRAAELQIRGRSGMRKDELIAAIRQHA